MRCLIWMIFILVMLPAFDAAINLHDCNTTTRCYVRPSCIDDSEHDFTELNRAFIKVVHEDCGEFIAIRPFSGRKWAITMNDDTANMNFGIKILYKKKAIFECKNHNVSTPPMSGIIISNATISGPGVRCSFDAEVSDKKSSFYKILYDMSIHIKYTKENESKLSLMLNYQTITEKLNCRSIVSYDSSSCIAAAESCTKPASSEPYDCTDPHNLLYQYNSSNWLFAEAIQCKVGEIVVSNGTTTDVPLPDGDVKVKCAQKKCRQCTDPKVSARFESPSDYNQCVYLQCNTSRMIINGNITHGYSTLNCSHSKWKINSADIDVKSIECVEQYDCRKFVELSTTSGENTTLNAVSISNDSVLSCDSTYQMAYVDETTNKNVFVSHISCDFDTGLWLIKDMQSKGIIAPIHHLTVKCLLEQIDNEALSSSTVASGMDKVTIWIIVAAVVVFLAIICILLLCLYLFYKRKKTITRSDLPSTGTKTLSIVVHKQENRTFNKDTSSKDTVAPAQDGPIEREEIVRKPDPTSNTESLMEPKPATAPPPVPDDANPKSDLSSLNKPKSVLELQTGKEHTTKGETVLVPQPKSIPLQKSRKRHQLKSSKSHTSKPDSQPKKRRTCKSSRNNTSKQDPGKKSISPSKSPKPRSRKSSRTHTPKKDPEKESIPVSKLSPKSKLVEASKEEVQPSPEEVSAKEIDPVPEPVPVSDTKQSYAAITAHFAHLPRTSTACSPIIESPMKSRKALLNGLKDIVNTLLISLKDYVDGKKEIKFERNELTISFEDVFTILMNVYKIFDQEPSLIIAPFPAAFVGDIHGSFQDLIKLFKEINNMDNSHWLSYRYVFMGDFADRGILQLEVIVYLFVLKIRFPDRFILLRGNHECSFAGRKYGLEAELLERYPIEIVPPAGHPHIKDQGSYLFGLINNVYSFLPYAAIIGDSIFAVHGGISEHIRSRDDIIAIKKRIDKLSAIPIVEDMVWSDPNPSKEKNCPEFVMNHIRNCSYLYSKEAVDKCLNALGVSMMIRGHQTQGVQAIGFSLMNTVCTLFSSSTLQPESNTTDESDLCVWAGMLFLSTDPKNDVFKRWGPTTLADHVYVKLRVKDGDPPPSPDEAITLPNTTMKNEATDRVKKIDITDIADADVTVRDETEEEPLEGDLFSGKEIDNKKQRKKKQNKGNGEKIEEKRKEDKERA